MEKIAVGPSSKAPWTLDAPGRDNLRAIAKRLDRDVEDLGDHRARSASPTKNERRHFARPGARIRLIGDGDLSAPFPRRDRYGCTQVMGPARSGRRADWLLRCVV